MEKHDHPDGVHDERVTDVYLPPCPMRTHPTNPRPQKHDTSPPPLDSPDPDLDLAYLNDKARNRRMARRADLRILPLCAWIYLLNYLDRGNIGNAKVLNKETHDDMLSQTGMSATDYAVAVSLFSLAYGIFEVPSNWIMKRYVRPSRWLGFLLFAWGVTTIGW